MILHPLPELSTELFTYDAETQTFISEASDLRFPIGDLPFSRVYDDACDVGFTLVSERTGKRMVFAIHEEDRDPDYSGGWSKVTLVPAELKYRNTFKVVIFND